MSDEKEGAPEPVKNSEARIDADPPQSSTGGAGAATPDYAKSLEFLRLLSSEGPWTLTSIYPRQSEGERPQGLRAAQFAPRQEAELLEWLAREGEKHNIYFSPNPLLRLPESGKAKKTDVKSVAWLHVDIDPRVGEDLRAEQERIRHLFHEDRPEGVPPPTVVIFSGGGYQALWKLREPFPVEGDLAKAEEVERYTRALEIAFGCADATHNVDRILRLPGTVNRPDFKKRAKGRSEARAELVEEPEETKVYDLAQFQKAPEVQSAGGGFAGSSVKVSGNVPRVALGDLPRGVSDDVKVVIAQGRDLGNPDKFGASRSEWVFWVCCEMVRAGCDDDTIYAVITDPDYAISSYVLSKGSRAHKHALRQISRARERAVNPWLQELNDKHAVIESHGGKCRILSWEPSSVGDASRDLLTFQSFADFRNRYCNKRVDWTDGQGKLVSTPAGQWWIQHRQRRQYRGLIFDPSRPEEVNGTLNLWRGFAVDPRPGDWSLMRRHVEEVLACGDVSIARYILRWAAYAVQCPERPAEVALVFRGGSATGKGTFARFLGALFGQHFVHVSSSDQVTGKHNAHLRDCVVLFADEACSTDDKNAIGALKRLITEPTLMVEPKFIDAVQWPNRIHLVMASNEDFVVPADADDRRFVVLDVSGDRREDEEWFKPLYRQMENGGLEAMLHDLLSLDLDGWHPRKDRPQTHAMTEQKVDSLRGVERAWFDCLQSGELPAGQVSGEDGAAWMPSASFLDWAKELTAERRLTSNLVSKLLGNPQRNDRKSRRGMDFKDSRPGGRARGWEIPPLREARRRWDALRFPFPWDSAERWTTPGGTPVERDF